MKYRIRAHRGTMLLPHLFLMATPYSTKLYVSRNGIFLDIIASLSVNQQLLLIAVDFPRLMYWLKLGIKSNALTFSSLNTTFRTFLFPQSFYTN